MHLVQERERERERPMAGSCEHGNELSGCIKDGVFLD